MSWEIWAAYALACGVLLAIPGPTILLVISYSLREGRSAAGWLTAGVVLGDLAAMVISLSGMGLLLSVSSTLFSLMKWIGAAYLVYLGVRMWFSPPVQVADRLPAVRGAGPKLLGHAFLVTLFNPKGITFFLAFFPQFLDRASPLWPQLIILGSTFLVLGCINAATYALLAGSARVAMQNPVWQKVLNRTGGGFLITAGVYTSTLQRG